MKNAQNYLRSSIDDIVFENRNKEYGAYQLRKIADRYTIIGLLTGLTLTLLVAFYMLSKRAPDVIETTIERVVNVTKLKVPEIPKVDLSAPAAPAPPTDMQSIRHIEMRPVDDAHVVTSDVPTIDQLKNKNISNVTDSTSSNRNPLILKEPIKQGTTNVKNESTVFKYVEVMPVFNGGFEAMSNWISNHINYPRQAADNSIEGTVYISFVINTDGSISDAFVERGIGFGCDEEALRAVEGMPHWTPGRQNNTAVRVKTTVPIKFETNN